MSFRILSPDKISEKKFLKIDNMNWKQQYKNHHNPLKQEPEGASEPLSETPPDSFGNFSNKLCKREVFILD